MFVLARAITYSTLFIGLLLVFLPARVLERAGVRPPAALGPAQMMGLALGATGALLALACILTFVAIGKGTPAPFDPPRKLVVAGPYRVMRNPMYAGAGLALAGAAIYTGSWGLFAYALGFLIAAHLFVVGYEEPHLRRRFGADYESYAASTSRWLPRWRPLPGKGRPS
jgi:protein-S-isoprenylcysteine O-methyltransferase Ste14